MILWRMLEVVQDPLSDLITERAHG